VVLPFDTLFPNLRTPDPGSCRSRGDPPAEFQVFKLKGTEYVKVKGPYKALGSKETRTVNLKKGTYKVQVLANYGHLATWSQPVTLRK
jgi:hypothetical protein